MLLFSKFALNDCRKMHQKVTFVDKTDNSYQEFQEQKYLNALKNVWMNDSARFFIHLVLMFYVSHDI